MAPKLFTAPKVWRRPYTSIYNDNYRYGNSLYSGAIDDIERKYQESMARTRFAVDRPDLHFETFAGHSGSPGSPTLGSDPGSRSTRNYVAESEFSTELTKSLSTSRVHNFGSTSHESPTRHHGSTSDALSALQTARAAMDAELNESRPQRRRRRQRPESAHYADDFGWSHHHHHHAPTSGGTSPDVVAQNLSMERCRELQVEIDRLNNQVIDAESRIKTETAHVKGKLNMEITDLLMALDEQHRVNQELDKTIRKQQLKVQDLQAGYESTQRAYGDAMEMLAQIQRKASQLGHEVDSIRNGLDKAIFKTTSTRYV